MLMLWEMETAVRIVSVEMMGMPEMTGVDGKEIIIIAFLTAVAEEE